MMEWRACAAVALLSLAGACSSTVSEGMPPHTVGEVPRDTRGDPLFAAIRPEPPQPVTVPMPIPTEPNAAVTTIMPAASGPATGVAVVIPTDPSQLPPPAKPVSCRHLKRC